MPASIYFPQRAAFIRVGPEHRVWGDPYTISMDAELRDDVAIVGGLDRPIDRGSWREIATAIVALGYRPFMRRVKTGMETLRPLPLGLGQGTGK